MSSYTTKQGDMWDAVALSVYGTISVVDKLMMANTTHIGTYIFPAGVVLDTPEFDLEESTSVALPPWKRVE